MSLPRRTTDASLPCGAGLQPAWRWTDIVQSHSCLAMGQGGLTVNGAAAQNRLGAVRDRGPHGLLRPRDGLQRLLRDGGVALTIDNLFPPASGGLGGRLILRHDVAQKPRLPLSDESQMGLRTAGRRARASGAGLFHG